MLQLLREAALADPAFRRYLPDGRTEDGAILVTFTARTPLDLAFAAAEYVLARPTFFAQELGARLAHIPAPERDALIALLVREGLIERYTSRL